MKLFSRFFFPAFIWFVFATILFTLPGSAFPEENWLDKIYADKWIHIGLFAVMVTLIGWGIYKQNVSIEKRKRYFIICGLICMSYGIAIEFIQLFFIPLRSFDIGDIIADTIGSFAGVWFCTRVYIKR